MTDSRVDPLLEISGVSVSFPVPDDPDQQLLVLEGINALVDEGEFVTIIGPSGCGKSTLLRVVAGLSEATVGKILIDGEEQEGINEHCSMVFQQIGLIPWRTTEKNILFTLEVQKDKRNPIDDARKVSEALHLVGLRGFENYYPYQISGGMQQRVGIARAIVGEPRLILMDEPFGALDAQTRSILHDELLRLREDRPFTTLFVSHDLDEAVYLSDRVIVLGSRPAFIREVIDVNLLSPRYEYDCRSEPEFIRIRKHLWQLLKEENQSPRGLLRDE